MPVHHRLRFLTFPMRASRLCSLWSGMRPLRFRRVPFGRDVAFDPGGVTASRIMMPHILPSTVPSVSASATLLIYRGRDAHYWAPTGSPEAVARLRFPQNVACGFPAPRSSVVVSQLSLLFAQVSFPMVG